MIQHIKHQQEPLCDRGVKLGDNKRHNLTYEWSMTSHSSLCDITLQRKVFQGKK